MAIDIATTQPQWVTDAIAEWAKNEDAAAVEAKAAHTKALKEARAEACCYIQAALEQCGMPYWEFTANDLRLHEDGGDGSQRLDWYLPHDGFRFWAFEHPILVIAWHCTACYRWISEQATSFAEVGRVFTKAMPDHDAQCPGRR